jgi:hypothetical protein
MPENILRIIGYLSALSHAVTWLSRFRLYIVKVTTYLTKSSSKVLRILDVLARIWIVLDWSGAKRGLFYRPIKQQITLRLDADLIDWFKTHYPQDEGYQTSINRVLREYVAQNQS